MLIYLFSPHFNYINILPAYFELSSLIISQMLPVNSLDTLDTCNYEFSIPTKNMKYR